MAMRDLITGSTACPDPASSSTSTNPLGALANALIGSSSKTEVSPIYLFIYLPSNNKHCIFTTNQLLLLLSVIMMMIQFL